MSDYTVLTQNDNGEKKYLVRKAGYTGGGSSGTTIDAYTKTETDNLLANKQDKGDYALKSEIPDISGKQDKLTAGENITIEGNVISATGGGGVDGFYYGLNQYCPTNIDNDAWLLSDGTWYNGDDYSGLYNWILTQYSNEVADFHSSTDDYTEFSWVINQTDKTFRLPLFTGNESLAGGKTVVLTALPTDYSYIAPANGWYKFTFKATASAQQCYLYVSDNSRIVKFLSVKTETVAVCLFVTRGEEVILGYTTNNNYTFQFSYARGYGNLYFYAGEKAR